MTHLTFLRGDDRGLWERLHRSATYIWGKVVTIEAGGFQLIAPAHCESIAVGRSPTGIGAVSGYARLDSSVAVEGGRCPDGWHHSRLIADLLAGWPLSEAWTGSFAAVAFSLADESLVICNDVLGYCPIYVWERAGIIIGGTSLIVLARAMGAEVDPIGVLQRCWVPNGNFGRRTPFKGIERLLPGESIRYSAGPVNRLYESVLTGKPDDLAAQTWEALQSEIELAAGNESRIHIALSGGVG